MAFDIVWSNEAEHSFNGVIDHLLYNWSPQEAHRFILRTDELINVIAGQPLLFKPYKNCGYGSLDIFVTDAHDGIS